MAEIKRPLNPERDRWHLGTLDSVLATSAETAGAYGIILREAPRGFSPPEHLHSREETGFLVMDGVLSVEVGEERCELGPNEFRFAPRGVRHWFRVESETARFLEIISPGGFEQFHLEVTEPAGAFEIPPPDRPRPSIERLNEASRRYGTTTFGPKKED